MCGPGAASLGAQGFGVGMAAMGSMFQARAQKSALRSQARIAEINASMSEEAARAAISAGTVEETRLRLAGEQAKAAQTASMAARNVDIAGSPTALARLTGTDLITEVDSNTIRANALRAAWGQRIDAVNHRAGARSARATASSISPGMAMAGSLISGAGQVAQGWYAIDKAGGFGDGGSSRYMTPEEVVPTPWSLGDDGAQLGVLRHPGRRNGAEWWR